MSARERLTEIAAAVGFIVAAAALMFAQPPHTFSAVPAVVCFAVFVVAMRVQIDTPFGRAVPNQLAFIPLLFVLPVSLVPVAVVIAIAAARLNTFDPSTTPAPIRRAWLMSAVTAAVTSGASAASAATSPRRASEKPKRSPTRSRRRTRT